MRGEITAKFTEIVKYRGRISIRQAAAVSPKSILKKLANEGQTRLFRALAKVKPVAIEGLVNCWSSYVIDRGKSVLIIIVRTAK